MTPEKLDLASVKEVIETNPGNYSPEGVFNEELGEGLFKAKTTNLQNNYEYFFINTLGGVEYPKVGSFALKGMYEVEVSFL